MSAYEAIVAGVLAAFALVGLRWQNKRAAKKATERYAEEARIARETAQKEHAELNVKAAKVAAAETGAEAFNAAFDD